MDAGNLTGAWFGRYVYANGRTIAFWATLNDTDGQLSGRTSERIRRRSGESLADAILHGTRAARAVQFVKAYDGAGDYAHAVRYEGVLDASGDQISGRWQLTNVSGAFTMQRTRPPANEASVERREHLPATA